ncbi:tRNA lysidine(34) synthetase TilS [Candidatus Karelsulcia muelleri]
MLSFKKFVKKLNKNISLNKTKIYIAVSGGLDSLVLLDLFVRITTKTNIQIEILHCNFKVRGEESDKAEHLIQQIATRKQIILHTKTFNIKNQSSKQIVARKLRYFWFKAMLKTNYFNYIALGHHLNDSIETVFINLRRGTGIKGIKGIMFKKKYLIRPLLYFTKKDIFNYAKKNKINWIEDSSNVNDNYLRNKIRKIINNFLNKENVLGIIKTLNILKEEYLMINTHLKIIKKYVLLKNKREEQTLSLRKIFNLYPIKSYLYILLKQYKIKNIKNIIKNLIGKSGKQIKIQKYYIIKKTNLYETNLF